MKIHDRSLAIVVGLAAAAVACRQGPEQLPIYGQVPAFRLINQKGAEVNSTEVLSGRVWVACFFFTSCTGPCPRMSARMAQLQQQLRDLNNVRLVSFSIDPERDRPEVLARYGERYGADPERWLLLTGPTETLQRLNHDVFMLGDISPSLEHSTRFVLVDQLGRVRGYYHSDDPDELARLVRHVRLLATQSSL